MQDFSPSELKKAHRIIKTALKEDIGSGDITTGAVISPRKQAIAAIIAKSPCVLAGIHIAGNCFAVLRSNIGVSIHHEDGEYIGKGETVLEIAGSARALLQAERTALNFLGRMSGIATLTARFTDAVKGTKAKILDTRKTAPGLRLFDKYAVRAGGGANHRRDLHEMFFIKENHIAAAGDIATAVLHCKQFLKQFNNGEQKTIVVEATTTEEAAEAYNAGAERVLLDNMSPSRVEDIVKKFGGKIELEVSGGITLKNIRRFAETGVDYISVGMLTHSAPSADFSLLFE